MLSFLSQSRGRISVNPVGRGESVPCKAGRKWRSIPCKAGREEEPPDGGEAYAQRLSSQ